MSSSRLVRGTKTRMFAIVCLTCVLGAVVFVFHGTQAKLAEVQKLVNSCNQQQESLSAQLQVIFEYKVRLEKSLTKEKEDHKQTKDTLESKLKDEKELREKENQEAKNKYEALVQKHQFLQSQLDDLKESEKIQVSKLTEEKNELQKEVDQLRKENKELDRQKDVALEDLKSEYLKQQTEISTLRKEKERLNDLLLPESDQNHLKKENFQMKDEMDSLKKQLAECEETKRIAEKPKHEIQQDTNVGDMPKFVYSGQKVTNGSTTPGLNPEAVNNYDMSSPKPNPEAPVGKKPDEQVAQPPKKPTQESVAPLVQPRQNEADNQIGQIPMPVNANEPQAKVLDPSGNTLHKPNTGNAGQLEESAGNFMAGENGGGEPYADQPKLFAPAPLDREDDMQKQDEIPRMKNEHYPHGGDYDRDQPDDDEDDEGEQPDYDERNKKEQKNLAHQQMKMPMVQIQNEPGVMINPK